MEFIAYLTAASKQAGGVAVVTRASKVKAAKTIVDLTNIVLKIKGE